jgi:cadmium resistance protein CadD (predicted permease)
MVETALIAAVAFAATNIDDAFVLLAFFAIPKVRDTEIVVGTYVGMAILVVAAMLLSAVCVAIFPGNLGLLGALPILVGLRQLWSAWRQGGGEPVSLTPGAGAVEVVELVAIRTIANGADNVAVYIPLFAGQSRAAEILTCVVFAVLAAAWCFAAKMMHERSEIGTQVQRWGPWITPIVLIALGVFVFLSNPTFTP